MGGIVTAIIIVMIVGIVLILLLTATNRKFKKACTLFEEKKYKEAEAVLKEIYNKHVQAPAKLASVYITCSSATSKGYSNLKKVLELSEIDLSAEAKSELSQKRRRAKEVITVFAKNLYDRGKYEDAVKFISLVENMGDEYRIAAKRYRSREAALKLDKPSENNDTLHLLLKSDTGDVVKNEVFAVAKELQTNKEYQRSIWLLELLPTDEKMLELFDSNVIGNINDFTSLLSCNSSRLKKRILDKAEAYTDSLNGYPDRQIQLYKAISAENNDRSIFDKIERLLFKKAIDSLKSGNYVNFKDSFTNLQQNNSISAPVKKELIISYFAVQFEFFRDAIKNGQFKHEWSCDWDTNIQSYARRERPQVLVELAKYLTTEKRFKESNSILIWIDQTDEEVRSIACKNVFALIEKEKGCTSIAEIYKNSSLYEFLASEVFKLAQEKSAQGQKALALHMCKLAEPSITDKKSFYVFLGKLTVEIVLGCKEESTTESLRYALDILKKKECKEIESSCIDSLQKAAEQFSNNNEFTKCYFICEQLRSRNESFSVLFLESAYKRCQQSLDVDSKQIQEEIRKKEDQYPDYARFIKYIPEFRDEYLKWTSRFITKLASSNKEEAVKHFNLLKEDTTKANVLTQVCKIDDTLFRELSASLLSNPKEKLRDGSSLLATFVALLSSHKDGQFAYTCFKSLTASGLSVNEEFITAALKLASEEKDTYAKLQIINDALGTSVDPRLLNAKRDIAAVLAPKDPDTSILICKELERQGVLVNDILLAAYIKKLVEATDIKEKRLYLDLSKNVMTAMMSRQAPYGFKGPVVCSDRDNWSTSKLLEKDGDVYIGYVLLQAGEMWALSNASTLKYKAEKTGLHKIIVNTASGDLKNVSLVGEYFLLENEAVALSDEYSNLHDKDNALNCLEGFPSLACEVKKLEYKLNNSKSISGDETAIKFIQKVIKEASLSVFSNCDELQSVLSDLLNQFAVRTIRKSKKQPRPKAIQSLLDLEEYLNWHSSASISIIEQHDIKGLLGSLCYEEGAELEERGYLKEAQRMYHLAINNECKNENLIGRHAICSVKRDDIPLYKVKEEVDKVKDSLPSDLKKDLLYRLVLRLLKADDIAAAESIVRSNMRSRSLLELCESCKLKKVKKQMLDFNDKVSAITAGALGYQEASTFIASITKLAEPILTVYPEYSSYFTLLPGKLRPYLMKAAYRSKNFKMIYENLIKEKKDFMSDLTLFRNLAVSCLGLIENAGLDTNNYKDVISIWLSAVFCDALIVKSLDYTSWDDGYTFCLDDSLSQTYDYDNLPENINFEEPSETNISIGSVQKSLLERTEGVLASLDQKYYAFYLQQKAAMTALVELFHSSTGNAIAPHTIGLLPASYANNLRQRLLNDVDGEEGLRVGLMYGFTDDAFRKYNIAFENYERCISAAKTMNDVSECFSSVVMSGIKEFSGLFEKLTSEVFSIVQNHTNSGLDYSTVLEPLCAISKAMGNSKLTHMIGEYLNGRIAQSVRSNSLEQVDALPLLMKSYLGCQTHGGLRQNAEVVLGNVIGDYINRGLAVNKNAILNVISSTRLMDSHIVDFVGKFEADSTLKKNRAITILDAVGAKAPGMTSAIAKAKDSLNVMATVISVVKGIKDGTSSRASDLTTMYDLYVSHKDHDIVCLVMAQVASACVSVYFFNGERGGYGVENTLNKLLENRSTTFNQHRQIFINNLNDMKRIIGIPTYSTVMSLSDYELNEDGKRLKKALTILNKFCK